MRKIRAVLSLAMILAAVPLMAQVVANDAYLLGHYTNGNCLVPDSRFMIENFALVNTGQIGSPVDRGQGTICADIYVFDANQEMLECCSCPLTANELSKGLNVCGQLLLNSLTQVTPANGVVKVVADRPSAAGSCDPRVISSPVEGGLRGWKEMTVVSPLPTRPPTINSYAEVPLQAAPLTSNEQQFLGQACSFVQYLGSGRGQCQCPGSF